MIEFRISFTQDPCREIFFLAEIAKRIDELCIVFFFKADFGSCEMAKIAFSFPSGRDVEIIGIHDGMRRRDDDGLRFQCGDLIRNFFIGQTCFFDLGFAALSDRRNDHRRMRDHKCCQDGHRITSFLIS